MSYPSTLSSFNRPTSGDRLNSPSHSALHNSVSSAVGQIEAFVGTLSSAVGTLVYDIRAVASNGGGHVQTANKGGTGQTSFAKGDILVAQSSSVISKLSVGSDNQVLVADSTQATGVKWGSSPVLSVTSFVSDGIWTKPSSTTERSQVLVEVWGGGGSGAGGVNTQEVGGGGGGAYVSAFIPASMLTSSVIVGVGAGGAPVDASAGNVGNQGGTSVFDTVSSLITAYGGGGGGITTSGAGGGGGGGTLFPGAGAGVGSSNGGGGGSILGGNGGNTNVAGQRGGFYSSLEGGGGGGGDGAAGGDAIRSGAGGGGVRSGQMGSGGTSRIGGSGSGGSILTDGSVLAGRTPAGGGGGAYGGGSTSGRGGGGKVVVTTFI